MRGRIVKGVGGFYYVRAQEGGLYACRAKGIFRNRREKPLVGDYVEMELPHSENEAAAGTVGGAYDGSATIVRLLARKNAILRPEAANVDQAVVIFAAAQPEPNWNLLDRFLISMYRQEIPVVLVVNKADLVEEAVLSEVQEAYRDCCKVLFTCAQTKQGLAQLWEALTGKTSVLAGPSGVGKSTLMNCLQSQVEMETGGISTRLKRGKHTTRHTELISIAEDTHVMDTPGFSSLLLKGLQAETVKDYYPEFVTREKYCRFAGCVHINEPDCAVKEAVARQEISSLRYQNYKRLYEEQSAVKRY